MAAQSQIPQIPIELLMAAAKKPGLGEALQAGVQGAKEGLSLDAQLEAKKQAQALKQQEFQASLVKVMQDIQKPKTAQVNPDVLPTGVNPNAPMAVSHGEEAPASVGTNLMETSQVPRYVTPAAANAMSKQEAVQNKENEPLASPEQDAEYFKRTGTHLHTGTTFKQADSILSENIRSGLEKDRASMAGTMAGRLDISKIDDVNKAWKNFDPQLMGATEPLRQDYDRLLSAKRMITTAGTNAGVLNPQQVTTVASEIANLAIGGGRNQRIASEIIDKYIPKTLHMNFEQKLQYISNNSQDAGVQNVMHRLIQEGLRIATESEKNIRDFQERTGPTLSDVATRLGQQHQFNVGLAGRGLDPETFKPTRSILPDFDPKQWMDIVNRQTTDKRVPDILGEDHTQISDPIIELSKQLKASNERLQKMEAERKKAMQEGK